ncbi:MAG: response regulator NasT [Paracoccaceae bacterium]
MPVQIKIAVVRKGPDRAKGLSEQEAHAHLRRAAMDQGKKLGEIAQALLTAADLLK